MAPLDLQPIAPLAAWRRISKNRLFAACGAQSGLNFKILKVTLSTCYKHSDDSSIRFQQFQFNIQHEDRY